MGRAGSLPRVRNGTLYNLPGSVARIAGIRTVVAAVPAPVSVTAPTLTRSANDTRVAALYQVGRSSGRSPYTLATWFGAIIVEAGMQVLRSR